MAGFLRGEHLLCDQSLEQARLPWPERRGLPAVPRTPESVRAAAAIQRAAVGVAARLLVAVGQAGPGRPGPGIGEYFGIKTVYDRYLLRHPTSRLVLETPQYFLLRVACGLSEAPAEAIGFYRLMSALEYLPSSPTLFNSGTRHAQMSSCFLVDSPRDELDSSVAAVNQGGRRKGAACVYLEPWHPDIEEFLELRDNTGEDARRTHNLNLANWVPDEFMRRVEADETWSLIDPDVVPELPDLWGEAFEQAYRQAEADGRYVRQVRARDLYARMMRTLAQTGNGWMTFKDAANAKCNQTAQARHVVHASNLCTEITEVTGDCETAVCNLGSVNLARHVTTGPAGDCSVDWAKLRQTVRTALPFLDRVIDIGYYPSEQAAASNPRWRPVGLGVMGLQDVLFALRLPFDSQEASELSARIAEEIYLTALETSADLAEKYGPHPAFSQTRAVGGQLQHDLWGAAGTQQERWTALRTRIAATGLRNSLLIAIAPTATIASIAGCYECIEPQVSNLFKRETLSGVPARMEVGAEDHLLPPVAAGDPDCPGHRHRDRHPSRSAGQRRRGRLLAGEPGHL